MANTVLSRTSPSLARLLSIDKDFPSLHDQITEAANILGLPGTWEGAWNLDLHQNLKRLPTNARAEWVLRWVLEKLGQQDDRGIQARADIRAWKLLIWTIRIIPASHVSRFLKDADFPAILEHALRENFDDDFPSETLETELRRDSDPSDSSTTVEVQPQPSRKRKRQSPGVDAPSKKIMLASPLLGRLFESVTDVVHDILVLSKGNDVEKTVAQHMITVFRTENAQAARILRFWLTANYKVVTDIRYSAGLSFDRILTFSRLPLALQIWEMRTTNTAGEGETSAELFSTECLLPAIVLRDALENSDIADLSELSDDNLVGVQKAAIQLLDRLFARHIFSPARSAFLADSSIARKNGDTPENTKANFLSTCLTPLFAKIEQAGNLVDACEPISNNLKPFIRSIPLLMELALRCTPQSAMQKRNAESPWLQAVFVAFLECSGCLLRVPDFPTPDFSLELAEQLITIVQNSNIPIDADISESLFRYHSGINRSTAVTHGIRWSLIAKLIALDADAFLPKSRDPISKLEEQADDLAMLLFDRISAIAVETSRIVDQQSKGKVGVDSGKEDSHVSPDTMLTETNSKMLLESIITPLMTVFARNRDLLGFISRWDVQLCRRAKAVYKIRKGSKNVEIDNNIWEDAGMTVALSAMFEKYLTTSQIRRLFESHTRRIEAMIEDLPFKKTPSLKIKLNKDFFIKAYSSTTILNTFLDCLSSYEVIEALEPYLSTLLTGYASLLEHEAYRTFANMDTSWKILARLFTQLWPIGLHSSHDAQETFLGSKLIKIAYQEAEKERGLTNSNRSIESRLSVFTFLLTVWDHLKSIPGWEEAVRQHLNQTVTAFIPISGDRQYKANKAIQPIPQEIEILMARFTDLLRYLNKDIRLKLFRRVHAGQTAAQDPEHVAQLWDACTDYIFSAHDVDVRNDLLAAMQLNREPVRVAVDVDAFDLSCLGAPVAMIPRKQREAIIDQATQTIIAEQKSIKNKKLTHYFILLSYLMRVPNSTAKICVDPSILFDMAHLIDERSSSFEANLFKYFETAVKSVLKHILLDSQQERNKQFLAGVKDQLKSLMTKNERVSIAEVVLIKSLLTVNPACKSFIKTKRLIQWLTRPPKRSASKTFVIPLEMHLGFLKDIPLSVFDDDEDLLHTFQDYLKDFIKAETLISSVICSERLPKQMLSHATWPLLHQILANYRLYETIEQFLEFSLRILQTELSAQEHSSVMRSIGHAASALGAPERMRIVMSILQYEQSGVDLARLWILNILISQLDNTLQDDQQKQQLFGILPTLCHLASNTNDVACLNALLDSMHVILRDKPFMTSQFGIESVLTVVSTVASPNGPTFPTEYAPAIFDRLCETTHTIVSLHRSRLGGRFHILLPLLQALMICLFFPNAGRDNMQPQWIKQNSTALMPQNAVHLTKVLTTLSSPTISAVTGGKHHNPRHSNADLVDPIKKARTHASQYLPPLVAWFCRCQLNGRLDSRVRERLMPGIWAVLECAAMDMDALQGMNAGLDVGTRTIWRGLWGEWRRVSGRAE